jgi:hypothetical protein
MRQLALLVGRDVGSVRWIAVPKFDPTACDLADRHYSRRKIGSPQFMPPGQTLVLLERDGKAVFGWWRPHPDCGHSSMNGLDGWTCTIFRNESHHLSSMLILEAETALFRSGKGCGPDGLLTYVFDSRIRSCNPGYCFQQAGWAKIGRSKDGKKTLLRKSWEMAGTA